MQFWTKRNTETRNIVSHIHVRTHSSHQFWKGSHTHSTPTSKHIQPHSSHRTTVKMRQYSKRSPQPQKVQVSKRRFRSAPSIGLPSSYPASPTMIAFECSKASPNSLAAEEEDDSLMTSLASLDHLDSMSSFDTRVLMESEGFTEARTPPPQQPSHHHSNQRLNSHHRRQRNRAFSDADFAAIMNDYTTNTV